MSDQLYIEEGYYDQGYFEIVKQTDVALEPYYAPDYAETGYIEQRGSLFTLEVTGGILQETSSSISTSSSLAVDGDRIRFGNLSLSGAFTPVMTVDIADDTGYYITDYIQEDYYTSGEIKGATATIVSSCSLNVSVNKIHQGESSIESSTVVSADVSRTRDTNASIQTSTDLQIITGKIHQGACNFGALFTPSVIAVAKINMTAIVDSVVSFEATANRTRDNDIALQNAVNLSLQAARIASAASNLASNVIQTTQAARTRDTQSSLAVSASIVAQGNAVKSSSANLNGSFDVSVTATVTIIKEAGASITASSNLTADAIQYVTRDNPYNRPINFDSAPYTFDYTNYFEGTASLLIARDAIFGGGDGAEYTVETDALIWSITNNERFTLNARIRRSSDAFASQPVLMCYGADIYSYSQFASSDAAWCVYYDTNTSKMNFAARDVNGDIFVASTTTAAFSKDIWYSVEIRYRNDVNRIEIVFANQSGGTVMNNAPHLPTVTPRLYLKHGYNSGTGAGVNYDQLFADHHIDYPVGDDNRIFFHGFNGDAIDAWGITQEGVADLSSEFALSFDPTVKISGASLQQSSGTLTADVNVTKQSSSSINASADITVDSTRVRFANSSQSSQFAQTVDAVKRVGVASSQSSLFALPTVDYIRIRNANIDTDAIATQLAVVAKVGDFFVNADSAFVQTATVVKRTNTDSALSVSFDQTASVIKAVDASASLASAFVQADVDSVRYRSTQAALDTNATQGASAVKTVDVITAQSSAFTQTVDVNKFSGNQVALNSEFAQADTAFIRLRNTALDVDVVATQSATAIKAVQASLTVGATTALTAQPLRIRPGIIDTDAIASQLTVAAKTGDFLINADVVATLSVDANVTTGNTVAIRAEFIQTVLNERTRETASSQTTTAELTAEPIIGVSASASINTATTLTVDAVAVKDAVVNIDGAMTFDATVRANLVGEIPVDIVSTLSATPSITREVGVTLSSDIAQTTTVSKQVPASASINSAFTQTANGRLIVFLEQLIYTVPRETRAYKIRNESREFVVDNESRTYQVRG